MIEARSSNRPSGIYQRGDKGTTAYTYNHLRPRSQNSQRVTKHFSDRSHGHVHLINDGHRSRSLDKWVGLGVVVKIMRAVTGHGRIF